MSDTAEVAETLSGTWFVGKNGYVYSVGKCHKTADVILSEEAALPEHRQKFGRCALVERKLKAT